MHLYGIGIVIYFCEGFQCYSFSMSYLDEEVFSGSVLFSEVVSVMLLSVFVQQARKFLLLDKELGRFCCNIKVRDNKALIKP